MHFPFDYFFFYFLLLFSEIFDFIFSSLNGILYARFKAGRRVFFAVSSRNRTHERSVSYHPVLLFTRPYFDRPPGTNRSFSSQRTVRFLVIPCDTREISLGMSYAIRINSEEFPLPHSLALFPPILEKKKKKHEPVLDQRHAR